MSAEVRRCAGCGSPALVLISRYERRMFGVISAGASDVGDWVCQRCGRAVTLHPMPWLWAIGVLPAVLGLVLAAALGLAALQGGGWPGLLGASVVGGTSAGVLGAFLWPGWGRLRHPVVPGAEVPEVRFTEVVPRRRCTCGQAAVCAEVTANRTNGIYTGTEYAYRCTCGRAFTVDSPLSMLLSTGGGAFLLALAWVCVPAAPEGWDDWLVAGVLGVLGGGLALLGGWRAVARVRFPVVRPAEP